MSTKKPAATATVPISARGIERRGSSDSSPIEAAASKPTKRRMPSRMPPSTPPPVTPNNDVWPGSNIVSVLPSLPPLAMITIARITIGTNETAANVEHGADCEAHADVVEDEDDRKPDHPPDPPGRAAVRDVRLPEAVAEDADAEVDAAAAEEERADEEEAGREDADPGVGAVGEVLVHRAGTRVLPGVERDRVGDREHAEAGEQHGEGGVPAGADVGPGDTAEHERDGEHRPDRERLRDGMHGREVLLAERSGCGVALRGLAHAITPSCVVRAQCPLAPGSPAR